MNFHKKISLGSAQFGLNYGLGNSTGMLTDEEVSGIISYAKTVGIENLDTAPEYGTAESRLGCCDLESFAIGTKLPALPGGDLRLELFVENSIHNSLSRLNVRKIYCYLAHRASDLIGESGGFLYRLLSNLKERNLCQKIGASIYTEGEGRFILENYPIDILQVPINIFDQRLMRSGFLEDAKRKGVEIHARSVFLQGLLLMDRAKRPNYFRKWSSTWNIYDEWLDRTGISPFQSCLNYVLQNDLLDKVVIGIDNQDHLAQLSDYLRGAFVQVDVPDELCQSDPYLLNPSLWFSED